MKTLLNLILLLIAFACGGCKSTSITDSSLDLSAPSLAATNMGHEPWVYEEHNEDSESGEYAYSYRTWKLKDTHFQIVDRRYPNSNRRYLYVLEVVPVEGERPDIIQVFGTAWTTTEPQEIPPIYEIIPNEYLGTRLHLKDGRVFLVLSEARQEDYKNAHDPLAVFEVIEGYLQVARVEDWYALFKEHAAYHQSYIDNGWSVNPLSDRFKKQLDRMEVYYDRL